MKRMSISVVLGAVVLLLAPAVRANTTCDLAIWLVPDGNTTSTTVSDTVDRFYRFQAEANRSYAITVDNMDTATIVTPGAPVLGTGCASGDVTGAVAGTEADASAVEPVTCPGGFGCLGWGKRRTLRSTAQQAVVFRIDGLEVSSTSIRVRVEETTLFSPRWSTFGGFYTSWGFQNNTGSTITGTLRVVRQTGEVDAEVTFSLPANRVTFRDTRPTDLNIPAGRAGNVVFIHGGPPGAVTADGFITNESGVVFVTVPVKFEARPSNMRAGP